MNATHHPSGFTLIEMAVAMFVLAFLLGSILVPLSTQVETRQIADTQKTMDEIRDALFGFAATNGYLPCADRQTGSGANDGSEDFDAATGLCSLISGSGSNKSSAGNVPWVTLGLGNQDAWGNRFRYTVLELYARRAPGASFSLGTSGGLRVCTSSSCATTLTTTAAAVIISHGRNGYSAYNAITNTLNTAATTADELGNANNGHL